MCRIRRADRANCAHTSCWLIASPGSGQHGTRRLLHAVWTQYLETAGHTRLARGSIRLLIVYEARATALQQTKSTTRARVPPSQDHHQSSSFNNMQHIHSGDADKQSPVMHPSPGQAQCLAVP